MLMKILKSSADEIILQLSKSSGATCELVYDLTGSENDLAPLFSGPLWSAIIWERSVCVMCEYLERNVSRIRGKNVVELGCGLGVPGLVAKITCDASSVSLTDRDEDLKVLRRMLDQNASVLNDLEDSLQSVDFDWSQNANSMISECADVILAIECVSADVYGRESLTWLLRAIDQVANKERNVLLLLCSVRRAKDGLDEVLTSLQHSYAANINLVGDFSSDGVELYEIDIQFR